MKKILVLDDNNTLLEMYTVAFQSVGYKVILCSDPSKVLEKAEIEKPVAIVSDIMMPGITGLELLKKFKQHPELKTIPIFLMTNLFSGEIEKEALSNGAEKVFVKTKMKPDEIVNNVNKFLTDHT